MSGKDAVLAYRVFVPDKDGEMQDYPAGTSKSDMPDWAVEQITNPSAWGEDAGDEPRFGPGGEAPPASEVTEPEIKPYAKWLKADLEAEVVKRNEARDADDHIEVEGTGTVKDLAAALDADDAAGA